MDDALKKALEFSNYQSTINNQIRLLKERTSSKLMYGYMGGLFYLDQSLISYVQMLVQSGRTENIPLITSNGTPVIVEDLEKFRDDIFDRYYTVINEFALEYNRLKQSRTVEALVS